MHQNKFMRVGICASRCDVGWDADFVQGLEFGGWLCSLSVTVVMAQVTESLPSMWQTWIEFLIPGQS